jgi:hypothetical protein
VWRFIYYLLSKLMPIIENVQQVIYRRLHNQHVKKMFQDNRGIVMKVKGKVVGQVQLKDIGRIINLDQIIELNEYELNRSQDLQNAIRQKWVEIVSGHSDMLRAIATPSQPQQQTQQIDQTQLLEIAKEMAKTMAQEMVKNNPDMKSMAKEMANEMVSQLSGKLVQGTSQQQKETLKIDEELANIVIDVDETGLEEKANIKEIGSIKEEKSNISGSLEKMRRFRRKPLSTEN